MVEVVVSFPQNTFPITYKDDSYGSLRFKCSNIHGRIGQEMTYNSGRLNSWKKRQTPESDICYSD